MTEDEFEKQVKLKAPWARAESWTKLAVDMLDRSKSENPRVYEMSTFASKLLMDIKNRNVSEIESASFQIDTESDDGGFCTLELEFDLGSYDHAIVATSSIAVTEAISCLHCNNILCNVPGSLSEHEEDILKRIYKVLMELGTLSDAEKFFY